MIHWLGTQIETRMKHPISMEDLGELTQALTGLTGRVFARQNWRCMETKPVDFGVCLFQTNYHHNLEVVVIFFELVGCWSKMTSQQVPPEAPGSLAVTRFELSCRDPAPTF